MLLRRTGDGDAAETELILDGENVRNGVVLGQADRIGDESVLELLDFADHLGLLLGSAVVVEDTDTSEQLAGGGIKGNGKKEKKIRAIS